MTLVQHEGVVYMLDRDYKVYIYNPDEPIQIGYWVQKEGVRYFDGVKEAMRRGDKDELIRIIESHKDCGRVQDPYSIRCIPQVHGASRDAFLHFKKVLECELNSITDNPIIFNEDKTLSGGNFHGQPLALPLDYIGLAASELGNISDRRTYLLLEGKWGLPAYAD